MKLNGQDIIVGIEDIGELLKGVLGTLGKVGPAVKDALNGLIDALRAEDKLDPATHAALRADLAAKYDALENS